MSYRDMIAAATGKGGFPLVEPTVKLLAGRDGLVFPVLFSPCRMHRPFRHYPTCTRVDCPLCMRIETGGTFAGVVPNMAWLPATYPIKSYHAICYPRVHRAAILAEDIATTGRFVDAAGDAVAGLNMRGSAASLPEHCHTQIHDFSLPGEAAHAFPLLTRDLIPLHRSDGISLCRVADYPAYALVVEGPWDRLAHFVPLYLAAANQRPHNFALAPGGRLYVIPRGLERAPNQENRFGASEMLGLITPVTAEAFAGIASGEAVCEALRVCGVTDPHDQLTAEEHAAWVCSNLPRTCEARHAGA